MKKFKKRTSGLLVLWVALVCLSLAGCQAPALPANTPTPAPLVTATRPSQPAVPQPVEVRPGAATGTVQPQKSGYREVSLPEFGITLGAPADWQKKSATRFEGKEDFWEVMWSSVEAASLEQACTLESKLNEKIYGPGAELTLDSIPGASPQQQNICRISGNLVISSIQTISGLVFESPVQAGRYGVVRITPFIIQEIESTLRFSAPLAAATQPPRATLPAGAAPTPVLSSQTFLDLKLNEYALVSASVDTPDHFEFNQRLPQDLLNRRSSAQQKAASLETVNAALARFNVRLVKKEASQNQAIYEVWRGSQMLQDQVGSYHLQGVNRSQNDFILMTEVKGKYSLMDASGVQPWEGSPEMAPIYVGDKRLSIKMTQSNPQTLTVYEGGKDVFYLTVPPSVAPPVKRFEALGDNWYLEVNGLLVQNGSILNTSLGAQEIFGWQVIDNKPFFFVRKEGKIRMLYNWQELPAQYADVIHDRCCEPAAFNPRYYADGLAFYAQREGTWYYVELGSFSS